MPQKWKMRLTWSWKYYLMMPVGLLESQLKALSRRQALESFVFLSWPVSAQFGAENE
jgi:hypothetical protein